MKVEMINEPSRKSVSFDIRQYSIVAIIPLLIIGVSFYYWIGGAKGLIILGFFLTLTLMAIGLVYFRQYFFRPIKATISEDSVLFEYKRLLRPRRVTWQEVRHLSVHPGDPSVFTGKYCRGGILIDKRWRRYMLRYKVAEAIRDAYRESEGHDPPIDEQWGY